MKKSDRSAWQRSAYRAAVTVALGLMLGAIPRGAGATCAGDCDGKGSVTIDELIKLMNIALGHQAVSACSAGASGNVTVTEIVTAVDNAVKGCGGAAVCGNHVTEAPEECDDGGACIGGPDAGNPCSAETACAGNIGACIGGTKPEALCDITADPSTACPGGKCVKCVTQGGDGCAANCTFEKDVPFVLVPGEIDPVLGVIKAGTSGATIHGQVIPSLPLPLNGSQVITIGKERDGKIPAVIKASSVKLDQIPILTIACACARGVPVKTCGGALFEADGITSTTSCSPGFSFCNTTNKCSNALTHSCSTSADCEENTICTALGKNPCAFVHGNGNSAQGFIGCDAAGLDGVDLDVSQDSGGEGPEKPPVIVLKGHGGPGSGVLLNSQAIGQALGACTPDFCTDADPPAARGTVATQPALTGTATTTIFNANGAADPAPCPVVDDPNCTAQIGPYSITGTGGSCSQLTGDSPSFSGVALAGAFTALDQDTVLDIAVITYQKAKP